LPKKWLEWYISSGEPLDKAGAYSIQGLGTLLVERIEGSYNNVVGYPIEIIMDVLLREGFLSFSNK
jgi:septum formation protein